MVALLAGGAFLAACVGGDRPTVTVEEVGPGEVTQTVTAPGRVEATARQEVVSALPGTVVGIDVEEGAQVAAGQVVIRLSSPQVDAAQQQAIAAQQAVPSPGAISIDLGSSGSVGVGGVGLGGGFGGGGFGGGAGTLVAAVNESSRASFERAREHIEKFLEGRQKRAALAALEILEKAHERGRGGGFPLPGLPGIPGVPAFGGGVGIGGGGQAIADQVSSALNQVLAQLAAPAQAQADAALAAAQAQQELLTVEAPFAGTVSIAASGGGGAGGLSLPPELSGISGGLPLPAPSSSSSGGPLRIGSQVVPGQTLFTVYDFSAWYIVADIDEVDIGQVQIGQRVKVTIDAIEGAFTGVVERIAIEGSSTEAGGIGYPVRIRILEAAPDQEPAPDLSGIRVGMTGSVDITTTTREANLVVPSRALLRRETGTVVFVVRENRAVEVPVQVDALGEDRAAVSGDLLTGDDVVVSGSEDLMDGQPVVVR